MPTLSLATEPAASWIAEMGATRCVIIPVGQQVSLDEVLQASEGKAIVLDEDEAGDDKFVVRIGTEPQQLMEQDSLAAALRENIHHCQV